jgi:hypothetical protein
MRPVRSGANPRRTYSLFRVSPNRPRTRPRFRDPWVEAGLVPDNPFGSPPAPKLKAEDEFEFDYDQENEDTALNRHASQGALLDGANDHGPER